MDNIKYEILNLKDFAGRIEGHDKEYNSCPRTLEIGKIKYYDGIPYSLTHKDLEYYFLIATVEAPSQYNKKETTNKVVGMVQLQKSPYDDGVMWLNFIEVDKKYQHKGIAKQLSENMCEFLKDKPWKLERSTPSKDGLKYIKSTIDDLLNRYRIVTVPKPKF